MKGHRRLERRVGGVYYTDGGVSESWPVVGVRPRCLGIVFGLMGMKHKKFEKKSWGGGLDKYKNIPYKYIVDYRRLDPRIWVITLKS